MKEELCAIRGEIPESFYAHMSKNERETYNDAAMRRIQKRNSTGSERVTSIQDLFNNLHNATSTDSKHFDPMEDEIERFLSPIMFKETSIFSQDLPSLELSNVVSKRNQWWK